MHPVRRHDRCFFSWPCEDTAKRKPGGVSSHTMSASTLMLEFPVPTVLQNSDEKNILFMSHSL